MSVYRPAESSARIQVAVAETVRQRRERKSIRNEFSRARRAGLVLRHKAKLNRREAVMATRRTPPPEQYGESDQEKHLRIIERGLQDALRHLRPLRTTIPVTRDAIKLIRQVQNLLEDAEDDAA